MDLALYIFKVVSVVRVMFLTFLKCYTTIIVLNMKNIWDRYSTKNNRLVPFLIFYRLFQILF